MSSDDTTMNAKASFENKASVKDYFERDHMYRHTSNRDVMTAMYTLPLGLKDESSGRQWTIFIERKLNFDIDANTIYSNFYIPELDSAINIPNLCQQLVGFFINDPLNFAPPSLREEIRIRKRELNRLRSTTLLVDARQIVLYIDAEISELDKERVYQYGDNQGMSVVIRDKKYDDLQLCRELHLAFISHDSRDKDSIARPLANELMDVMGRVWFDEYSLKLGASLRESIERGLRECKRCVLILTPNFLSNSGWTKTEFNSIFTRELIEKTNVIIPVWAGVTPKQVYEYSPSLADKVAANWNDGCTKVALKIRAAVLDSQ
jgi:hypothetical protein